MSTGLPASRGELEHRCGTNAAARRAAPRGTRGGRTDRAPPPPPRPPSDGKSSSDSAPSSAASGGRLLVRMPAAREVHAVVLLGDPPVVIRVLQVEPDGDDLDRRRRRARPRAPGRAARAPRAARGGSGCRRAAAGRSLIASAPITTVHSPRGGRAVNSSTSEAAVPRCNVSWILVSSRATTTGRSPSTGVASRSVLVSRIGDSKNAMVRSSRSASSRTRTSFPAVRGRNPRKQNALAGKPLDASAAVIADAPGIGVTRWPPSSAARTSSAPGSLSTGVPASVQSARVSPRSSRSMSCGTRRRSSNAGSDSTGLWMSCAVSSTLVRRESSAITASHSRSTRSARKVMSSRLPIGVATTASVPVGSLIDPSPAGSGTPGRWCGCSTSRSPVGGACTGCRARAPRSRRHRRHRSRAR